jgi:hypothetical protein
MRKPRAKFKIKDHCFCKHHYAFRGEAPFRIVAITEFYPINGNRSRWVYIVMYDSDEFMDAIPVVDEGGYEMMKVEK